MMGSEQITPAKQSERCTHASFRREMRVLVVILGSSRVAAACIAPRDDTRDRRPRRHRNAPSRGPSKIAGGGSPHCALMAGRPPCRLLGTTPSGGGGAGKGNTTSRRSRRRDSARIDSHEGRRVSRSIARP